MAAPAVPQAVTQAVPFALPANPRILVVKVSSLGDVVHNMPLIHDLRARWPGARIDWVVEEGYVDLVRLLPDVARVIPFALRRWRKRFWQPAIWHEIGEVRGVLVVLEHGVDVHRPLGT